MSGQASHILRPPVPNDGDALLSTTMASSLARLHRAYVPASLFIPSPSSTRALVYLPSHRHAMMSALSHDRPAPPPPSSSKSKSKTKNVVLVTGCSKGGIGYHLYVEKTSLPSSRPPIRVLPLPLPLSHQMRRVRRKGLCRLRNRPSTCVAGWLHARSSQQTGARCD